MKALTILAGSPGRFGKQVRTDLVSDTIIDNDLIPESEIDNYMLMRSLRDEFVLLSHSIPYSRVQRPSWRTTDERFIRTMPKPTDVSFADASDLRSSQVAEIVKQDTNLPIYLYWSGGIDSTAYVSAVMRNWSKDLLDRCVIKLSQQSINEHPIFYNDYIRDKFQTKSVYDFESWDKGYYINGDPADGLWLQANLLTQAWATPLEPTVMDDNFWDTKNEFLASNLTDYFYEYLLAFIKRDSELADFPVTTTADFFWWMNFSLQYETMIYKHLWEPANCFQGDLSTIEAFQNHMVPWYDSIEYQQWSMQSQMRRTKFNPKQLGSYKMESKEYIYEFDKNEYTRQYKTKMPSRYVETSSIKEVWWFDDGTQLELEPDEL